MSNMYIIKIDIFDTTPYHPCDQRRSEGGERPSGSATQSVQLGNIAGRRETLVTSTKAGRRTKTKGWASAWLRPRIAPDAVMVTGAAGGVLSGRAFRLSRRPTTSAKGR